MIKRRVVPFLLILCLVLISGCGDKNISNTSSREAESSQEKLPSNDIESSQEELPSNDTEEMKQEEKDSFANSTPENDTDKGLRVVKLDTADDLTDDQKMVLQYFDQDYLYPWDYDALRRTPQIFDNAQVRISGQVVKTISMDSNQYQMVMWFGVANGELASNLRDIVDQYVLITGNTGAEWFVEGDVLDVKGKCSGVESVTYDGKSYTLPKIEVYEAAHSQGRVIDGMIVSYRANTFDLEFIKRVAETIFGDIEIRKPVIGTDVTENRALMAQQAAWVSVENDYFLIQLENQKNSKFNRFLMPCEGGQIIDIKDEAWDIQEPIERYVEFSADFSHFFLFTYDTQLEMLTLEYYDSNLDKIWKREFMETTSAEYDFTKNNIYLNANNELYIINTETGEDTYSPTYVGSKKAIRKLPEGVLMISESKSDGVMLTELDGTIKWKTNLDKDVLQVEGLQIVDDRIVFSYDYEGYEGTIYMSINKDTGDMLIQLDATNDYNNETKTSDNKPAVKDDSNYEAKILEENRENYLLPDSSTRLITEADISGFLPNDLMYARNEIYARHGYIFNDPELSNYFNSKIWYTPKYTSDQFSDSMLNDIEKKNIQFIKSYEK